METILLAHALGAEIRGTDITATPSEEEINEIRSNWHKHHVIVFRGIGRGHGANTRRGKMIESG